MSALQAGLSVRVEVPPGTGIWMIGALPSRARTGQRTSPPGLIVRLRLAAPCPARLADWRHAGRGARPGGRAGHAAAWVLCAGLPAALAPAGRDPPWGFLENVHVSPCREVHMKDRGRAMGVIARSRLTRGDDQTLPTCTGAPQALTAIQ